jgi:putative endonuclease
MAIGKVAEDAAAAYLARQGLRLVARNWRCKGGEIDLIMQDGQTLVFVEVRARSNPNFGGAAASITAAKQARLVHAAQLYLAGLKSPPPCRFDAVLFDGPSLDWLRNAFDAGGQ